MPPLISIVGKSKSGKTTLIEGLISELRSRGYRVATIKHAASKLTLDKPGKDSWRHIQAGSQATVIISPNQSMLLKPIHQELGLDEVARLLGDDYDIILAEGFKQSAVPKIEVHRRAAGAILRGITNLIAIATDEPLQTGARQFSLHDVKGLADLLENSFLKNQRDI